MKSTLRLLMISAVILALLLVVALAENLSAGEARKKIAAALGFDNVNNIHIKDISTGMGGQAVVEATVDTAFRLAQDKQGNWQAVEIRAGDRRWESFELIETAIRKEKILRTTADLRTLVTALEAFRRERGGYVAAESGEKLIDQLAPRFMPMVMRFDAWSHPFEYKGTASRYKLSSSGPDGKPSTGDDIIIENGQLVGGVKE
ncbi:MAG: type II secretion system protein GspG [Acidobacteriota bacterium]